MLVKRDEVRFTAKAGAIQLRFGKKGDSSASMSLVDAQGVVHRQVTALRACINS
jgi:hypothetical protein